MKIAKNITELIGKTPLVELGGIAKGAPGTLIAKLESFNPCSSVKDRSGLNMIEAGEGEGLIGKGTEIVEPTSGNTGIAMAFVCAAKKYSLVFQ